MNTETVEIAIEKYVLERMEQGKKRASEHFVAYAYVKHGSSEITEFMKKAGGLARYYMDYLKVIENPLKGPEIGWFGAMIMVGIFSCYLIGLDDQRVLGMLILSGTLVHFGLLIFMMARKWSETGVMIAIYREIAEIADREARRTA